MFSNYDQNLDAIKEKIDPFDENFFNFCMTDTP